MQLYVLGEIHLRSSGHQIRLPAGRERELLAHLALAQGQPIPAPELADRLWEDAPPRAFRSTLHTYATRLRRRLEAAGVDRSVLAHTDGGYLLHLATEDLDWGLAGRLRSRAAALARSGDRPAARSALEEALRLWTGVPLVGLPGRWMERMRTTMRTAHQEALGEWARLSLETGDAASVAATLADALVHHPTSDRLHLWHLRALRALGRTTDALVAFHELQEQLSEKLGASPSRDVQAEFHALLEESAPSPQRKNRSTPNEGQKQNSAPNNLGRDPGYFRGRSEECEILTTHLREQESEHPRVWVVSGMAGIGKSTLATRVAHRVGEDFPDARIDVDLRGNHEQLPPLTPEEAVTELLRLLRLPAQRIPESLPDRLALWHEHTRSMRALVILDDAATAEQVRPLLPAGERCAVIVTSRFQLPELDDVAHLPLGLPTLSESVEMFAAASDQPVNGPDTETMEEVITRCGRLPLAMRLIATLLRLRGWSPRDMLRRLPPVSDHGLDAFRVGQRDIAGVFDLALRAVSAETREAFLLLGLHPTRIVSAPIAQALIGWDRGSSRRVLDELVGASLAEEHEPDRFRFHTLVKGYAYDRARATLSTDTVQAARKRMHTAYLEACRGADRVLYPHRPGRDSTEAGPGAKRTDGDPEWAQEWFRRELPTVLTVIGDAQTQGPGEVAADLSHVLAEHLDVYGPSHTAPAIHEHALAWHQERRDTWGTARASFDLARALVRVGNPRDALAHNAAAEDWWSAAGDDLGVAWSIAQRGMIHCIAGRYDRALTFLEEGGERFEVLRSRPGIIFVLRFRGVSHFMTSAFHEAIADFSDAIGILRHAPDPHTLPDLQLNLAGALQQLGYHRESGNLCQEVLDSALRRSDHRRMVMAWGNLGELALHRQRPEQAVEFLSNALDCLRSFHDPWSRSTASTTLGLAHVMMDCFEDARPCFQLSLDLGEFSSPAVTVDALLGLAQVEQADGNQETATRLLRKAVETASHHGLRKEAARSHHALGQHLDALGEQKDGRRQLEKAARLYNELAAPEADVVRTLLETPLSG
ncbi:BTAD domain-containing putative transcriptional regulator [Nocardiopsis sp. FIRDI 009]|uniref:AfsR/SARP family transcriptional regulator n=1 Tax=Nocardiopsis sp. FIRDI 009 TaxID=714197 RepID=UPI000E225DA2|nr:BTAD domain-containing putative transcriptional regulator [Nocardiopsis sp. FIRDI 009]